MTTKEKITRLEDLLTAQQIVIECSVADGLAITTYPNEHNRHDVWAVRSIFQNVNGTTPVLFILDEKALSEMEEDVQKKVINILRRHLRLHYGLKPDFL